MIERCPMTIKFRTSALLIRGGMSLVMIALLLLTGRTHAQAPGPGGFDGPGRPRGRGFGGPMFRGPGGMQAPTISLLVIPDVQKELAVTPEQLKEIEAANSQHQLQMRTAFESVNFQELQNLTEDERQQHFAEMREKSEAANKESDNKLRTIL